MKSHGIQGSNILDIGVHDEEERGKRGGLEEEEEEEEEEAFVGCCFYS